MEMRISHCACVLVLLCASGVPLFGNDYYCPGSAWVAEVIDSRDDAGQWSAVWCKDDRNELDIHVSYSTDSSLMYGFQSSAGSWTTEVADLAPCEGEFNDIVVYEGYEDVPHISYTSSCQSLLRHAWKSGGSWHAELIDEGVQGQASIDLMGAATDYPYISYHNEENKALMLAGKEFGGWSIMTVDSAEDVDLGFYNSMRIKYESPNTHGIHIAYTSHVAHTDWQMKYAYSSDRGQSWTIEPVGCASGDDIRPREVSIDVNDDNYPVISFYATYYRDLGLAYKDGSGWHTEWVDKDDGPFHWMGLGNSIRIDICGGIHIAYLDEMTWDLRYIADHGSGWLTPATVDSDHRVGSAGLGVNRDCRYVFLSYYANDEDSLWGARCADTQDCLDCEDWP